MDMSRSRRAQEHECGHGGPGRMHDWALSIGHDELRRTVAASWPKATGNNADDVLRQRHGLRFNGNRGHDHVVDEPKELSVSLEPQQHGSSFSSSRGGQG